MSNNLKFEFDFDEVFEGIKQGVIRELTDTKVDAIFNSTIINVKNDVTAKVWSTYQDERELKNEIKTELKNKVYDSLIKDIKSEYKKIYSESFSKDVTDVLDNVEEEAIDEIKEETINRLYNNLYSGIQQEISNKMQSAVKQLVNNIGGNNIKVKETNNLITKEEYEHLLDRNRKLEALEHGGVDNWEWYGESLSQYYDED